jgi:hypothetical protein
LIKPKKELRIKRETDDFAKRKRPLNIPKSKEISKRNVEANKNEKKNIQMDDEATNESTRAIRSKKRKKGVMMYKIELR